MRGSWWGHPKGHDIFRVSRKLAVHPDVMITKLISSKVTYVHRKLWPELITVATSQEAWQMQDLSRTAESLLDLTNRSGKLTSDRLKNALSTDSKNILAAIRELEKNLLIYSEQFHSETGAHAKNLESWEHWAKRVGFSRPKTITTEQATKKLEQVINNLNLKYKAKGQLPWT